MNYSEVATEQRLYLAMAFTAILVYIMIYGFYQNSGVVNISVCILVIQGIWTIMTMYKRFRLLVVPISIFSAIWYILLPLTSYKCPLMDSMSKVQWEYCLLGMVAFSIGGFVCVSVSGRWLDCKIEKKEWKMSQPLYSLCIGMILFSILLYLIQAVVNGGFPIMAENVDAGRRNFYLPGLSFLSNTGFLAVYLIFCDKSYRKKKMYWVLVAIYIGIQILMAVRFLLYLVILMLLSTYGNNPNRKNQFKIFLRIVVVLVIGFLLVAAVRGGTLDKKRYFIDTGIYGGTVKELTQTEMLRYFGMSQRMMEEYINHYAPGSAKMGHTFYPILNAVGIEPYLPEHYGRYGYTACNIITYFYFDAGKLWWVLMIVWSYVMNLWYIGFRKSPDNIMSKYKWSLSVIGLVMSFYCYVNSYSYWCFHFVIILTMIEKWNINLFPFKMKLGNKRVIKSKYKGK